MKVKDRVKLYCRSTNCVASIDVTGVPESEWHRHADFHGWIYAPPDTSRWVNPMASKWICKKCAAKLENSIDIL